MNLSQSTLNVALPVTALRTHPAARGDAETPGAFQEGLAACLSGDCPEPELPKAVALPPGPLLPPVQEAVAPAAEATRFAGPKGPVAPVLLEVSGTTNPETADTPRPADLTNAEAAAGSEAEQLAAPDEPLGVDLVAPKKAAQISGSENDKGQTDPEHASAAPKRDAAPAGETPDDKVAVASGVEARPAVPLAPIAAEPGSRSGAGADNPPRSGAGKSGATPRGEGKAGTPAVPLTADPASARPGRVQTGASGAAAATPALPDAPAQTAAQASPTPVASPEPSARAAAVPGSASTPPLVMTQRADWPQTVVSATLSTLTPDGGTMILELAPEELGALTITLTLEGDTATVSIQTETQDAARALNEAERELVQDFARHGVTLSAHDAQTGRRSDPRPDPPGSSGHATEDDANSDPAVQLPPQGILNLIA